MSFQPPDAKTDGRLPIRFCCGGINGGQWVKPLPCCIRVGLPLHLNVKPDVWLARDFNRQLLLVMQAYVNPACCVGQDSNGSSGRGRWGKNSEVNFVGITYRPPQSSRATFLQFCLYAPGRQGGEALTVTGGCGPLNAVSFTSHSCWDATALQYRKGHVACPQFQPLTFVCWPGLYQSCQPSRAGCRQFERFGAGWRG